MGTRRRLAQLGEFGYLKKLLPRLYWPPTLNSQLCIGPGDDAGALRLTPGKVLVGTTDTLVEGVHFERRWLKSKDLGWKLLAVNISDLAAMGDVRPLAALVTVALPGDTPVDSVDNFYTGLRSCAQRWKVGFLGGDTVGSRRDWVVSATVLGEADPRGLVKRSGARVGDLLVVHGPLGLAAAGLEVLQKGGKRSWTAPLVAGFAHPQPQCEAATRLGRARWATSMMDVSDGLEASLHLMADASHVGFEIDFNRLPIHDALKRWAVARRKNPIDYVFKGGEDYALVFTVRPNHWTAVQRALPGARQIGRVVKAGQGTRFKSYGYAHFA
jgi:thiamine-monophosphate kinase